MFLRQRCSENEDEAAEVKNLIKEVVEITGKFNVSDYIWFCKNLDLQGIKKRLVDIRGRFDKIVERIMEEHREVRSKRIENGHGGDVDKDLLDILLDISEDESLEMRLSRENIKAFVLGFVAAVNHMREFVPAIYDLTFAFPKDSPPPTMLRFLKGKPSVVHVHIKRHLTKNLPEMNEAVAQWCKDVFLVEGNILDKHKDDDSFGDGELHVIGRPLKSLVVVTTWACLLILGTLKFLRWSSLLSSWKGLTFSATGLAVLTVLMQFLIQSTQSEAQRGRALLVSLNLSKAIEYDFNII